MMLAALLALVLSADAQSGNNKNLVAQYQCGAPVNANQTYTLNCKSTTQGIETRFNPQFGFQTFVSETFGSVSLATLVYSPAHSSGTLDLSFGVHQSQPNSLSLTLQSGYFDQRDQSISSSTWVVQSGQGVFADAQGFVGATILVDSQDQRAWGFMDISAVIQV